MNECEMETGRQFMGHFVCDSARDSALVGQQTGWRGNEGINKGIIHGDKTHGEHICAWPFKATVQHTDDRRLFSAKYSLIDSFIQLFIIKLLIPGNTLLFHKPLSSPLFALLFVPSPHPLQYSTDCARYSIVLVAWPHQALGPSSSLTFGRFLPPKSPAKSEN